MMMMAKSCILPLWIWWITQCFSLKLRLINECLHVTLFIFRRVQILRKKKKAQAHFFIYWFEAQVARGGRREDLEIIWEDRRGYMLRCGFCPSETSSTILKCVSMLYHLRISTCQCSLAYIWFQSTFFWFLYTFLITYIYEIFLKENN